MNELVLDLPPETLRRLESLAEKMGHSLEECGRLAIAEFIGNWEDHLRTMDAIEQDDDRPQWGTALE